MGLNDTPAGDRIHISIFGRRNAGKSSLINAITGQELAIVSNQKGTTTDPVYKAMELLPLGPVLLADTPGLDDEGALGALRMKKTMSVLNQTDIAVLAADAREVFPDGQGGLAYQEETQKILEKIREKQIPYVVAVNQTDLLSEARRRELVACVEQDRTDKDHVILVSAVTRENIRELKELIASQAAEEASPYPIVKDLVEPLDVVVLVIPIDEAAPKGRLILPQQQTIRELLEAGAVPMAVKETELGGALCRLKEPPALVITDSQVFRAVNAALPREIPLTSFSILMARHKGGLKELAEGQKAVAGLSPGDRVLISEGCTHHRQCNDIGTVKIPRWLEETLGFPVEIETSSGGSFPEDLSPYRLVIHCGGCMLSGREMRYRIREALDSGVPIVNYGIFIAGVTGILERSLEVVSRSLL